MDSMRFKLAILNVLANCPGGRATLNDMRREVEIIIASGDQMGLRNNLSMLSDVDIFQSGLVLQNDAGLQITRAGLSLLHSLESNSEPSLETSSSPASQEFRLLDDLIGAEDRLRIFDLGLRELDDNTDGGNQNPIGDEKDQMGEIVPPVAILESRAVDPCEKINPELPERDADTSYREF